MDVWEKKVRGKENWFTLLINPLGNWNSCPKIFVRMRKEQICKLI